MVGLLGLPSQERDFQNRHRYSNLLNESSPHITSAIFKQKFKRLIENDENNHLALIHRPYVRLHVTTKKFHL